MKGFKKLEELKGVIETKWRYDIHKYFSIKTIDLFKKTKISANSITIFAIIFGVIGAGLIMSGNHILTLGGILLFHLAILFDGVDGAIARINKKTGKMGAFMDELMHIIVTPLIMISFSISAYFSTKNTLFLGVAMLSLYLFYINKGINEEIEISKKNKEMKKSLTKKEVGDFFRFTAPFNYIFFFGIFNLAEWGAISYLLFISLLSAKNLKSKLRNIKNEK